MIVMNFTIQDGVAIIELLRGLYGGVHGAARSIRYRAGRLPYYIADYNRTVTVYKDGHGVITNALKIKVLDWQKFKSLERYCDIGESCRRDVKFPPFEDMLARSKSARFDDFGFWYQSTADIIRLDDAANSGDYKIGWTFRVDPTKISLIKKDTIYLTYAISVPGLFPVRDGYFDVELARTAKPFSSELCVENPINRLTYLISFDKEVHVHNHVVDATVAVPPFMTDNPDSTPLECEDDLFYYRYFFKMQYPKLNAAFKMTWQVESLKLNNSHKAGETYTVT
jgi:hypothetical protein